MLVTILVGVLIAALILGLLQLVPVPEPFKTIIIAVGAIMLILWILGAVGVLPMPAGVHVHH